MKFSTSEFHAQAKKAGLGVASISHGMSYRAGQTTVIAPAGVINEWGEPLVPVRVESTDVTTFDSTGYDGRGRTGKVLRLVPDEAGLIVGDEAAFTRAGDKGVAIGSPDAKSGNGFYLVPREESPAAREALNNAFAGLLDGFEAQA